MITDRPATRRARPGTRSAALAAALLAPLLGAATLPVTGFKQIVDSSPASAWRPVAPENLLLMQLGDGRRVAIELAPEFAPVHVANIRTLARIGWWDGASIVRVQDDYVAQWAQPEDGRKPHAGLIDPHPPAEYDRPSAGLTLHPLGFADAYASRPGFVDGWPVGGDGSRTWLAHCYGMVGVGRDMPPDTGSGTELYSVNGTPPRQLDRNIALVGRIVGDIETLSALPRGTGDIGYYADPKQRIPIASIRLASDLPAAERPAYQVMRTDSPSFSAYLDARANRRDAFYVRPAGGVDLCNVQVPTRPAR